MTKKIRAILFDKDGTLLDFNGTWLAPYEAAARYIAMKSGGKLSVDSILAAGGYIASSGSWQSDSLLASGSNEQIFSSWSSMLGAPFTRSELNRIGEIFTLSSSQYVPVFTALKSCLETLKNTGYTLGIATMDDESHALTMARGLGIDTLFDFICGADSGHGVKPEPGMVQAFAHRLGITTDQVAMVGDSPRDIKMGQNAGAGLSIGVLTGAHDAEELGRYTPHVLASIGELFTFLNPRS